MRRRSSTGWDPFYRTPRHTIAELGVSRYGTGFFFFFLTATPKAARARSRLHPGKLLPNWLRAASGPGRRFWGRRTAAALEPDHFDSAPGDEDPGQDARAFVPLHSPTRMYGQTAILERRPAPARSESRGCGTNAHRSRISVHLWTLPGTVREGSDRPAGFEAEWTQSAAPWSWAAQPRRRQGQVRGSPIRKAVCRSNMDAERYR